MKIENNYLVFEQNDFLKNKKITGHSFVGLCGFDNFKKQGDVLLSLFGLFKEEIDKKYIYRGDLAEKIVKQVYDRNYKTTIYDKKSINYDNFQEYQNCGGLIDIELIEEKTLIEVKSKSMKDYDYISKNIDNQKSEIYQALYYGYLRNYDKITMEYIFFDEQTENEVFNNIKPTTLSNLKRFNKVFAVDKENIKELIKSALTLKDKVYNERKVSLDIISDEVLSKLGFERPNNDDVLDTLPF